MDNSSLKNNSLESTTNETYSELDAINTGGSSVTEQKHHNPPFYGIVDYLFAKATKGKYAKATKNATAEELSSQIKGAKRSAALWGGISTLLLTTSVYVGAKNLMPNHFGDVATEWQGLGLTALVAGILYHADDIKDWNKKHPVYMAGMKAVMEAYTAVTVLDMALNCL